MKIVAISVGFLAVVLALGMALFFGSMRPRYNHTRQFISELGEIGAPNATVVNFGGFLPTGFAVWVFLVLVTRYFPRRPLDHHYTWHRRSRTGLCDRGVFAL
jgi:hypothetical membrane protein